MLRIGSGVLLGLPSSVPTRSVEVDPRGIKRERSFSHFFDGQKKSLLRVLHRHLWIPSEKSAGLVDDDAIVSYLSMYGSMPMSLPEGNVMKLTL